MFSFKLNSLVISEVAACCQLSHKTLELISEKMCEKITGCALQSV